MEEDFKKVIEEIKKDSVDEKETKKYILAIKRDIKKLYDNCKGEKTEEQIIAEYLEEYRRDLEFRGNAGDIFNKIRMYEAYRRILANFKGNKAEFDSVVREAKKRELQDNAETICLQSDIKESMISAVRYMIRNKGVAKEKELLENISIEKSKLSAELRTKMISVINFSLMTLDEYGIMDEYIEGANEELEKLGLAELRYQKRNPIPDEQYDKNGQLVQDVEDIGILDTFSKENLEQISIEDLGIITAFWESKYFQERLEISKAMSAIQTLDLWGIMLHEDDSAIEDFDSKKLEGALKKDLAITYVARQGSNITPKMKRQYKKFMKEQNLEQDTEFSDEVAESVPEIMNLESAAKDISLLECLIMYQLLNKSVDVKNWGIVGDIGKSEEEIEGVTIAIENKNFRGPLLIGVPTSFIEEFTEGKKYKIPQYDKKLNEQYCNVMSRLYLPTNKFFNNFVRNKYKENPSSRILAELAGKKIKGEER